MQIPTIKPQPSLGTTADEVLANALKLDTAGYTLYFQTVFDGTHYLDPVSNQFKRQTWSGTIPVTEAMPATFEQKLLGMIANGEVTVRVSSPGLNPHFSKEYHRANGRMIPLNANVSANPIENLLASPNRSAILVSISDAESAKVLEKLMAMQPDANEAKCHNISLSEWTKDTGLTAPKVWAALKTLKEAKLLSHRQSRGNMLTWLNFNVLSRRLLESGKLA